MLINSYSVERSLVNLHETYGLIFDENNDIPNGETV